MLFEIAGACDGLVANFHLAERFDPREHVRTRALRTGRWEAHTGRLLRSVSAPVTTAQRVRAAVLDAGPGTILFGPSTPAWSGLGGYQLARLHVARGRGAGATRSELAPMHHLRGPRAHHVAVIDGIVTQSVLRAIWCEAAHYASPRRVEIGPPRIGHPPDQGPLGSDHDEVDVQPPGQFGDLVRRTAVDVVLVGDRRGAGVAGRDRDVLHRRVPA